MTQDADEKFFTPRQRKEAEREARSKVSLTAPRQAPEAMCRDAKGVSDQDQKCRGVFPMTQDTRQAAAASDYEAKARELADVWAMGVLAALQSAHAAGLAQGDAAGFERGVRAAADNANLLHGDALFKWQTRSNPYDAGYDDAARKQATSAKERILALLPSQPKETTQ